MRRAIRRSLVTTLSASMLVASVGAAIAEDGTVAVDDPAAADDVVMLRDAGVGWGAIVKVTTFAEALGMTAEEYLASVPVVDGDFEFDFGGVDGEVRAQLYDGARNYGELVRAVKALADDEEALEAEEEECGDGAVCEDSDGSDDTEDEARKAEMLAEAFGVDADIVLGLRAEAGWGVVFKLLSWSQAMGLDDPMAMIPESGGWSLGKIKKAMTDEQLAALEGAPRNFGQLNSGRWTRPDDETADAPSNGKGKGKAKGKNKNKGAGDSEDGEVGG